MGECTVVQLRSDALIVKHAERLFVNIRKVSFDSRNLSQRLTSRFVDVSMLRGPGYPESDVLLCCDCLDLCSVYEVGKTWIVFSKMHDFKFDWVDLHLPVTRPLHYPVHPLLHFPLILVLPLHINGLMSSYRRLEA